MLMGQSFTGSALMLGIMALYAPHDGARAACPPPGGEETLFVSAAHDLQIASGRAVRLSGVSPGLTMPLEGTFRLVVIDPRPDRWGRVAALVLPLDATQDSVNATIIRQGLSVAVTPDLPADCAQSFLAAEAEARAARRGLWAEGGPVFAATDRESLRAREGQFTLVHGRVFSVRVGQKRIFLNFGAFGSERFSVTVAVSRLPVFQAAGLDLAALKGQDVEVRGIIAPGLSMELTLPVALVKLRRP